jgi:ureidoglycolate hydrolase
MTQKSDLIEITKYEGDGYKPLIDYEKWRVAILNYCDELLPENIEKMQRHNQTDEVFILLKGECILFLADGNDNIGEIIAVNMEPLKLYNIKKTVWHTHTLSKEAMVLIVENQDTSLKNSPEKELNNKSKEKIINFAGNLQG